MHTNTPQPAGARDPQHGPAAVPLARLVRGHLDGVASILDVAGPELGLKLRLDMDMDMDMDMAGPGRIGYARADAGTVVGGAGGTQAARPRLGPDVLVLIPAGPDPGRHLSLEAAGLVARQLPDGARALLLLGYPPAELPYHQILGLLAAGNCLILDVAALDEADFGSAIVLARADAGRPEAPARGAALRNMNECALGRFVEQALRARLADLERAGDGGIPEAAAAAGLPAPVPGAAQAGEALERDRLARALRSTQRELVAVYEKLMALERSTSLEVGRAVIGVARRPWRDGARLPLDLYRLWRDRGGSALARRTGAGAASGAGAVLASLQDRGGPGLGDRWLAAYTTPGQLAGERTGSAGRLVIAGALTALSCATIEPDAIAAPLLPHDADFVLEGTGADLVLIETAALLPGCAWAYAGDPAATDRGRRLAAVVSLARSLGKPVVLLRNAPGPLAAGPDWLAAGCDAVIDGDLGVQLARFNPIGLDPRRPCDPVYAARRDPGEPLAVRRILDELTGSDGPVAVSGAAGWRSAPARYRGHGLFVAASHAQAREQLAAGARVVGPVGAAPPVSGGAPGPDAPQAAMAIEAGRRAGARDLAEIRPVLRDLFENHATPARLASLARRLGLPVDATASRRIAVVAELPDASHAQRLGHDLMRQRFRPAEVIVSLTGPHPDAGSAAQRQAAARALRGLADSGASVRVLAGAGPAAAAAAARSPWLAPWNPARDHPDCYLLDLACAAECSRADAVGHAPGADYVFTQPAQPALARRDLLRPGAPAVDAWGRNGLRMLAVSA